MSSQDDGGHVCLTKRSNSSGAGFRASTAAPRRGVVEQLHYATEDWLNMVFIYSNVLTLDPVARAGLRSRLAQFIAAAGVDARNDAVAVLCTPQR
jgi:hypothetical protein